MIFTLTREDFDKVLDSFLVELQIDDNARALQIEAMIDKLLEEMERRGL